MWLESLSTRRRLHREGEEVVQRHCLRSLQGLLSGFRVRLEVLTVLLGIWFSPEGEREPF